MRKKTPSNPYEGKRHRWYGDEWLMEALKALAEANRAAGLRDDNPSKIIVAEIKKKLRANAPRIRKAGFALPEELFVK